MKHFEFKAFAVHNEVDLNKIAVSCGIPKKYTWEEPLILDHHLLANILGGSLKPTARSLFSLSAV